MHDGPAAVIGTSLTGLLLSRALSAARQDHLLIGPPPNRRPRLGESLNLEGTLELLELEPGYHDFYHPKASLVAYLRDSMVHCDFTVGRASIGSWMFRCLGFTPPRHVLHLDRIGFDQALWDQVSRSPHCLQVPGLVREVGYDPETDAVERVVTDDGRCLTPAFVFDATNHARLVARAAGCRVSFLSTPNRIVFAHYAALPTKFIHTPEWLDRTNLLRLHRDQDGAEGFAWCIPIGQTMSVGASVPARDDATDGERLMDYLEDAFARRGISFREFYPRRSPAQSLHQRYFTHERAYGRNWLLAGPSFCQIWFMSSSGIGSSTAAARVAPHMLREPASWGRRYEAYARELVVGHQILNWFATHDPARMSRYQIRRYTGRMVRNNLRRLATYARLCHTERAFVSQAFRGLFDNAIFVRRLCSVIPHGVAENRASLPPEDRTRAVALIFDVISGRVGLDRINAVIHPEVVIRVDDLVLQGLEAWTTWVRFLRAGTGAQCQAEVLAMELDDDEVTVSARWITRRKNQRRASDEGRVVYRFDGPRVIEIRTTRANYAFLFGRWVRSRVGFLLLLGMVWSWKRLDTLWAVVSQRRDRPAATRCSK